MAKLDGEGTTRAETGMALVHGLLVFDPFEGNPSDLPILAFIPNLFCSPSSLCVNALQEVLILFTNLN